MKTRREARRNKRRRNFLQKSPVHSTPSPPTSTTTESRASSPNFPPSRTETNSKMRSTRTSLRTPSRMSTRPHKETH